MRHPTGSSRRLRPWLALIVIMLVGLVSCGEPVPVQERPDDGPLTILSGRDQSGGQRAALVAQWNLQNPNPNRKARIVELPPNADAQRAEMLARAQSGAGNGVDVYNLDVTWTAEFAEAGYLRQLDEAALTRDQFLAGFLKGPLRTCRYPRTEGPDGSDTGPLWALPFNADVGLLYYNKQLLGSAPEPTTWDEVAELASKAKQDGATGYIGQYGDYEGLAVTAQELVWSAGGELIDDEGRVMPDAEDFESGLQRLQAISPSKDRPFDEAASTRQFREGRTLFMRNWPIAYRDLYADKEKDPPAFEVIALPENSGALGGQNLAVSASTSRYQDAVDLIKFLTDDARQTTLYRDGGLPATRTAAYNDDKRLTEILPGALENAHPRPTLPHYATLSESFRTTVTGFLDSSGKLLPTAPVLRKRFERASQGRTNG
ncbi:MAG TPA: extracellular solute-binding protein [Actinophytocola sp.]|nr:extracellular solute-binding protein [Actinophytocola sp.]